MRHRAAIMLLASLTPLFGQEKARTTDPSDFRSFLVESQIVEYRPKSTRDPFQPAQQVDRNREQTELMIDEYTIAGRVIANKKTYLIMLDPQQNVKQMPVGARFQDGEITAITETGVTFTTWDPALGPRSPVKRTVTKNFRREEVR